MTWLGRFGAHLSTIARCFIFFSTHASRASQIAGRNAKQQLMAVIITCVTVYGTMSVASKLESLGPDELTACTDKPCNFVQLFPDAHGRRTGPWYMSVQNGALGMQRILPTPYGIQSVTFESGTLKHWPIQTSRFYGFSYALHVKLTAAWLEVCNAMDDVLLGKQVHFNEFSFPPGGLCPDKSSKQMKDICNDVADLKPTSSRGVAFGAFQVGLFLWLASSAVHDVFVLRGHRLRLTITLAWVCLLLQGLVACAAMWVAADVIGVFYSKFPGPDGSKLDCACYYRLNGIVALLSLVAPFGLLYKWQTKLVLVLTSAFSGDILYYKMFYVPFESFGITELSTIWAQSPILRPQTGHPDSQWERKVDPVVCEICDRFAGIVHLTKNSFVPLSFFTLGAKLLPKMQGMLVDLLVSNDLTSHLVTVRIAIKCLLLGPAACTLYLGYSVLRGLPAIRYDISEMHNRMLGDMTMFFVALGVLIFGPSTFVLFFPPASLYIHNEIHPLDLHMSEAAWSACASFGFGLMLLMWHLERLHGMGRGTLTLQSSRGLIEAVRAHSMLHQFKRASTENEKQQLSKKLRTTCLMKFDEEAGKFFQLCDLIKLARDVEQRTEENDLDPIWADELSRALSAADEADAGRGALTLELAEH